MCQAIWLRIETRCALVVVCSYACRAGWASHRPSRRGSAASTLSSIECSSRNARCTVESLQRFGGKVAKQRRSRPQGLRLFVLRRKAWAGFVSLALSCRGKCAEESRQRFEGQVAKQRRSRPQGPARGSPVGTSARIWRGGRGDSLCDDAAETRRRTARRAAPRRTRFREENHGKDASATAAGGSGRPISASAKKVSGRFRDA